jgi:hypothetical protein
MVRKQLGRLKAQLGLARLERVSSAYGSAGLRGRPARLSRPAHGSSPPTSLMERAEGAAPLAPLDRRVPLVGLSLDLVWRPDPVRLGPVRICVRVGRCVCGVRPGRSMECPNGVARPRTRHRGCVPAQKIRGQAGQVVGERRTRVDPTTALPIERIDGPRGGVNWAFFNF